MKTILSGTSLAVQWLGLCASTTGGAVRPLVWELGSRKLRRAAKKQKTKQKNTHTFKCIYTSMLNF